jgi:hypothetical protein
MLEILREFLIYSSLYITSPHVLFLLVVTYFLNNVNLSMSANFRNPVNNLKYLGCLTGIFCNLAHF